MPSQIQIQMNRLVALSAALLMVSCIPYSFAPDIEGTKLVKAKKFKGNLPDMNALVFEDPYGNERFQRFMQERFEKDSTWTQLPEKIPVRIGETTCLISFYERERADRSFNLFAFLADGLLESENIDINEDDVYTTKRGFWYIILVVTDGQGQDCLSETYEHRLEVTNYLRLMYFEYINPIHVYHKFNDER